MDIARTLLNILVVEDHDDLREATVAALGAMGYAAVGVDCAEAQILTALARDQRLETWQLLELLEKSIDDPETCIPEFHT
mgnify:CR=1 FL=1